MRDEISNLTCETCGRALPIVDAWASRWIAVLIGNVVTVGALHVAYSRGWWAGTMRR